MVPGTWGPGRVQRQLPGCAQGGCPDGPIVEETELESREAEASRVHRSEVREERAHRENPKRAITEHQLNTEQVHWKRAEPGWGTRPRATQDPPAEQKPTGHRAGPGAPTGFPPRALPSAAGPLQQPGKQHWKDPPST